MAPSNYHLFSPLLAPTAKIVGDNILIGAFSEIQDYVLLESGRTRMTTLAIGARCKIKQGAALRTYDGSIHVGNRVSVGEYTVIAGHGGVRIGECSIIAGHCYFSAANHIFSESEPTRFQGETTLGIDIGDNVWIGGNVTITDGVRVGEGCVIGAGSVVTRSLPPYALCYGAPCRVVRLRSDNYRFDEFTEVFQ